MGLIDDLLEKEKKTSYSRNTPPPNNESKWVKYGLITLGISVLTLLIFLILVKEPHQAKQTEPVTKIHAALKPPYYPQKILSTLIIPKQQPPTNGLKLKLDTKNTGPSLANLQKLAPSAGALKHQDKEQKLISLLEQSSSDHQNTIKLYEILTKMYLSSHQFKSAEHLLTTGLKKAPQSLPLNFLKAQLQVKQGQLDQALNTLRTLKPNLIKNPEYYGLMAKLHLQQDQNNLAQMLYQQLINIQPTQAKWWLGLGLAFEQQNKFPQAQKSFQYARKLEDKNVDINLFLDKKITETLQKR